MKERNIVEKLPYVDGVVECGDSRQIDWLKSNENLSGANEPNSNKGTANRVPLSLYRNIVFLAKEMDKSNLVINIHDEKIEKLIKDFEYFGGEEFAKKIEDIIKEQEELGETNLEILLRLESTEDKIVIIETSIGTTEEFVDMEGSVISNLSHIASIIGNKEGEDFYGNIVEGNEESGVYETMTNVIKTVNSLRTKITEFDNSLNNLSLQVSGQDRTISSLEEIVGDKAKVVIGDKEVELVHDDAIEQLFGSIKTLSTTVKNNDMKVLEHTASINRIEGEIEKLELGTNEKYSKLQDEIKSNTNKIEDHEKRIISLESSTEEIPKIKINMSEIETKVSSNILKIETLESSTDSLDSKVSGMGDTLNSLSRNVDDNSGAIENLVTSNSSLQKTVSETVSSLDRLGGEHGFLSDKVVSLDIKISDYPESEVVVGYGESIAKNTETISENSDFIKTIIDKQNSDYKEIEALKLDNSQLKESNLLLVNNYEDLLKRVIALETPPVVEE